jgi:hypothetical protein
MYVNKLPTKEAKSYLYDAIESFSDGDQDVYTILKSYIYALTHATSVVKQRSCIAMILFFTDHNEHITNVLNNYLLENTMED